MPNAKERLIRCLKYCASTTETGNDCVACERWVYDCGSGHCVDDLMLQAAEALEQMRWIPVSERLPEANEKILVCSLIGNQYVAHHLRGHFYVDGTTVATSHWMPLPEPPKGE